MTEKYLHFLWKMKKIPAIGLKLTDNRLMDVIHFGYHNRNQSGPDFSMGIINLDGTDLIGPIEMHLRSSDWYRHKHHLDANYDNVILHVVYEDDRSVVQKGRRIPTLELREMVDPLHRNNYQSGRIGNEELSCKRSINDAFMELEEMKKEALILRWKEKALKIQSSCGNSTDKQILTLLGLAFGTGINKKAFEQLCARIPLPVIRSMDRTSILSFIYERSVLNSTNDKSYHVEWEFSGFRPQNHPEIRVKQFAEFVAAILFSSKEASLMITDLKELRSRLDTINDAMDVSTPRLSKKFIDHLIINVFVPAMFIRVEIGNTEIAEDDLLAMLRLLKPENNRIVKYWEYNGVSVKTAFDSQALLALNQYFCSRKKCLSCKVSDKVLNTLNDTENCFLF